MRVFVTGATGFIGSAVVAELLGAGHEILGLARSPEAARALTAAGAQVQPGTIKDRDSLRWGAERADGVIHVASPRQGLADQVAVSAERTAIRSLGAALAGSGCPLLVTSATAGLRPGALASEQDRWPVHCGQLHAGSEQAADAVAAWGVRVVVLRLPPIVYDAGLLSRLRTCQQVVRVAGLATQAGWRCPCWAAVHRLDAARLYRLALEQPLAPGTRLHAVAVEGVPLDKLAAAWHCPLGQLASPLLRQATILHKQLTYFAGADLRATSWLTQQQLGWQPQQESLLASFSDNHCPG